MLSLIHDRVKWQNQRLWEIETILFAVRKLVGFFQYSYRGSNPSNRGVSNDRFPNSSYRPLILTENINVNINTRREMNVCLNFKLLREIKAPS